MATDLGAQTAPEGISWPKQESDFDRDVWISYASRLKSPWSVSASKLQQATTIDPGLAQPASVQTVVANHQVVASPPPIFVDQPWRENFIILARWSGRVTELFNDRFFAALSDDVDPSNADEEAEIPIEEVSEIDRGLIKAGALFYWSIGYRIRPSGQRSRESMIRFRRLPSWSSEEIERARNRVKASKLRTEDAEPARGSDATKP